MGNHKQWSFHIPRHHHQHHEQHHHHQDHVKIPKGCLAVKVGHEGEDQERFVIPVMYFNHPLFGQLLKEAEEEFGFAQKGTITIPCHVEEFRYVRGLIDQENSKPCGSNNNNLFDHHRHHQNQNHLVRCFRV